jgi:hypothetical protein
MGYTGTKKLLEEVYLMATNQQHQWVSVDEYVELVSLNLTLPVDIIYEETSIPMDEQLDRLEEEERGN